MFLDRERRILDIILCSVGDALLIAALLGGDRKAVHRRRELERAHPDLVLLVRIVQHAVESDLVDFGHCGDVAGDRAIDFDLFASLKHQQVRDLERLALVANEELGVLGHGALIHTEDAELADERIHDDLEHVREHVLLRIGLRTKLDRARLRP